MKAKVVIRKARKKDHDSIWEIIRPVIAAGDTYVFAPDSSKEKMLEYWCGKDKYTYVALIGDKVAGTFILKDNFPDLGSHVANASYMTHPNYAGQGVGKTMGRFSLEEARKLGYKAMQFNIVVKTNERAIRLWEQLGFEIVGEIPEAFQHPDKGHVNAYIMWKAL